MDDKIIDIFSREAVSTKSRLPDPPRQKKLYKPYEVNEKVQICLKLNMPSGAEILLNYAYQSEMILHTNRDCIEIRFAVINKAAIIHGRNFEELVGYIRNRKLETLSSYIEQKHFKPQSDDMVITNIAVVFLDSYYQVMAEKNKS